MPKTDKTPLGATWSFLFVAGGVACGADSAPSTSSTSSTALPNPSGDMPSMSADLTNPAKPGPTSADAADDTAVCDDIYEASGIPFATAIFTSSDACPAPRGGTRVATSETVTRVQRDAGATCMSGQLADGFAILIVSFDRLNAVFGGSPPSTTRQPLDAPALGVEALRFTLDPAPANGLQVALSYVSGQNCTASTMGCIDANFYIMMERSPGVPLRFERAGTETLRFADFQRAPWADPTAVLDLTRLAGVEFQLQSGDFDFCIRDFELLDASGNPVMPPEPE